MRERTLLSNLRRTTPTLAKGASVTAPVGTLAAKLGLRAPLDPRRLVAGPAPRSMSAARLGLPCPA